MRNHVVSWLCSDLSRKEIKNSLILAGSLFFIIGSYWLMRPLKDAVFANIVGIEYQPIAKLVSLSILVPLMLGYAKLVDILEKHKLFYYITIAFIVLFFFLNILLGSETIGITNTIASPKRLLGWSYYVAIESFGSLMVAMFWSFVTSSTDLSSAKKSFPFIIIVAQSGAILGPTLDTYATVLGIPFLMNIALVGMVAVFVLIYAFMRLNPICPQAAAKDKKKPTGMLEGLRLLLTEPYVLGILVVATFFDIVYTIMDFQMKVLARQVHQTPEAFAEFLGRFGQSVNVLAFVFALTGTGFLLRRFGLKFCLLFFPAAVAVVILYVYAESGLFQIFAGLVVIKGLAYGLNNPVKEIMYIPTTKDVQFKAKGWIDVFGNRTAKATGSLVNHSLAGSVSALIIYGSIFSMAVVAVWALTAFYVGRSFEKLTHEEKLIGSKKLDPVLQA